MLQKNVQVNRKILATPTVQYALYKVQYTLYTVQSTVYTLHTTNIIEKQASLQQILIITINISSDPSFLVDPLSSRDVNVIPDQIKRRAGVVQRF